MALGKVKWFNEIRGTGVIRSLEGNELRVHFREILEDGFRTLCEGELVEFEIRDGSRGPEAVNVERVVIDATRTDVVKGKRRRR